MLDVMNGTMLTPGLAGQHLLANVADGIELDRLDEKWKVDKGGIIPKLKSLSYGQMAILEVWTRAYWESSATGQYLKDPDASEEWVKQISK